MVSGEEYGARGSEGVSDGSGDGFGERVDVIS